MTFDDDFLMFHFEWGTKQIKCKAANIKWPPPEFLELLGIRFRRTMVSELSDDDRQSSVSLTRGALYQIE